MENQDPELFQIGDQSLPRGLRKKVSLPIGKLFDDTEINIPIEIIRGRKPGPTLFISAAIHGDELNGVEVCKRLLALHQLKTISGTLIVIPVVNIFGFNSLSRYLPDRRDLNRCFPGSPNGSLASRIAYMFTKEIVEKSTHGIDLHTGAIHRYNLPQIRAETDDPATRELALSFGTSVIIKSNIRDGSLRQAGLEHKIPMLLFEGGEALRVDESVIAKAFRGILSVMTAIGMLHYRRNIHPLKAQPFIASGSSWIRASKSGMLRSYVKIGQLVGKGDVLGIISNPYGEGVDEVRARRGGIVIGALYLPVVHIGDALFHIADFEDAPRVEEFIAEMDEWEFNN